MINRQFLYFKTEASFLDSLEARKEIKDDSIVFIEDKHAIWTHGKMFGVSGEHAKGFFKSVEDLPAGIEGDWAIVKVDDGWYIFVYDKDLGWTQTEKYEFSDFVPLDMDEIYVRKDNIRDFIRNLYDDIYVKKVEVYTPDQYDSEGGSDSPSSGSGSSSTSSITVDQGPDLDKNSLNPVASWVIYKTLKNYVTKDELGDITIDPADVDLSNYYKKDETYSKDETYTKAQIDALIASVNLTIRIVDSLPAVGDPRVMYMIKSDPSRITYDMWVYTNGQWAQFGSYEFNVDMDEYLKVDAFDTFKNGDLHTIIANDVTSLTSNLASKIYVNQQITNSTSDVVRWGEVYTPDQDGVPSMQQQVDTAGYDPHTRRAGASLITPTYVTYEDLEQLLEMVSSGSSTINVPKHVILEESEYNVLAKYATYEANTLYFVLEPKQEWTFGGTFPVILGGSSIGEFPITLT